ncbi:hypothetical protein ACFQY5_30810 [Paeniroseomonas aquatica]
MKVVGSRPSASSRSAARARTEPKGPSAIISRRAFSSVAGL